eukprot:820288_1
MPLTTSIIAPIILFIFGYIISCVSFKRGREDIEGCHNVFVAIWILLLAACVAFTSWNAYNMIHDNLADDSVIYDDMVYAVVGWNLMLMLISCNVMIRSDADGIKR